MCCWSHRCRVGVPDGQSSPWLVGSGAAVCGQPCRSTMLNSPSCCGQSDGSRWARRGDFLPMLRRAGCCGRWKWECEDLGPVRVLLSRLMAVDFFLCDVQNVTVQKSQFEQRDSWRRCVWCVVNTKGLISRLIRSESPPLTPSLRNFYKNANAVLFKSVWRRAANYFQPLTKSLW